MYKSVKLKEDFHQVCVWPGTELQRCDEREIMEFELGVEGATDCKIQFLERILTNPDTDENGREVFDTGGRSDILFAVHKNDVMKFSLPRMQMGIRWIEDVLANCNYRCHIYPDHVYNYISWNEDSIDFPEGACCEI